MAGRGLRPVLTVALAALCVGIWVSLWVAHGRFWQSGPELAPMRPAETPAVDVVIPARNEAGSVTPVLRSLLAQEYRGELRIFLVDDRSEDGTGELARMVADKRLTVIEGAERPEGWSGKLWAVQQGVAAAEAPLLLLCDADIVHAPDHVARLVAQLGQGGYDLVSEMVALNCASPAERALVPAFVYFFQLLYPFEAVNDAGSALAAAAGGTMLVRASALARIGGIAALRGALIDDVTLATRIKRSGGRIWLGHTRRATSLRPYPGARDVWRMVARTAFVQLRYSWGLLAGCVAGLALTFVAPPLLAVAGHGVARWLGLGAYALMCASFVPTLRRFGLSPARALLLPLVAVFYMAATVGSAIDHARGVGVRWKDRAYTGGAAEETIR